MNVHVRRICRYARYGIWILLGLVGPLWVTANVHADAVDEAFVRGHAAAQAGDWQTAIVHYQRAEQFLPEQSALISYNLGTAYANLEKYGYAVFYLRRALLPELQASDETAERARYNLGLLRQKMEVMAEVENLQGSRPESGWDFVLSLVHSPLVGFLALLFGYVFLALLLLLFWWTKRRPAEKAQHVHVGVLRSLLGISLVSYLGLSLFYGFAMRAQQQTPQAIVLDNIIEVREGPGVHRKLAFKLQGGSEVRIIERSHGWSLIRLRGGLEGWVPDVSIGQIGTAPLLYLEATKRAVPDSNPHG